MMPPATPATTAVEHIGLEPATGMFLRLVRRLFVCPTGHRWMFSVDELTATPFLTCSRCLTTTVGWRGITHASC